jgi:hypothetical protein
MMRDAIRRWRRWRQARSEQRVGDPAQLKRVRQMLGPAITRPQAIEHCMYVVSADRADEVSAALSTAGFEIEVSQVPDCEPPWEIIATRWAVVNAEEIAASRALVEPMVDDYDGWSVPESY